MKSPINILGFIDPDGILKGSAIKDLINNEIKKSEKRLKQINFFAKRYAAKEACAKALGTGLAKGVFWKDIEVFNDQNGKPFIKLHNNALNLLNKNFNFPCKIELSLSDEKNYSIANVIIFKHEK